MRFILQKTKLCGCGFYAFWWFVVILRLFKCWLFCRMCLAKMSTCNLSDLSSSFCKNTSSHDSHTEVHQPSSIRKSMTSHHTSSGHHLYEGDLVSKTSNLNESSISSNWAWAWASPGGGGEKNNGCPIPRAIFLRTPKKGSPDPGHSCWRLRTH